MNSCCKEVVEPSIKLARMIRLLKIIAFLHFVIIIGDIFLFGTGFYFALLIQFLALLISISSKHFGQYLYIILLCFINTFATFRSIGAWFQIGFYKEDKPVLFGFEIFILVFEIFFIYVLFQVYKQAKHEFRIKMGYIPGEGPNENNFDNDNEEELNDNDFEGGNNDNNNNQNNNGGGFNAFQGNGVPVGGN